ncbi:uncharacterized protein C8Q71DRAFT_731367 [Rhodofomes roseus]|uniref:Uncharacterized protein n=1 Tax=Rhodofomes roseus TaxID=34475 RepID=A0ABQ8KZ19_9APHY|nr:uncharacterized protein C8Q71DRAFT_731367 [Rhodofomes roseus]KAH9844120.1 hypothetical protein C8Q71DRAFT_731367 [Rhodofomes roseus]
MENASQIPATIPAESVVFIAEGSFTVCNMKNDDQNTDWVSGVIAIVDVAYPDGPSQFALFLVDSDNREHSFAAEMNRTWIISECDERLRLFGWTVDDQTYRVHLQDDDRRRFLSLARNFTVVLEELCASARTLQNRLRFIMHKLPSSLSLLQGVHVNSLGRLEKVPAPPMAGPTGIYTQMRAHAYPPSPESEPEEPEDVYISDSELNL